MSDAPVAKSQTQRPPARFRAALAVLKGAWTCGVLTITLPSGETFRLEGAGPGPGGHLIIRDYAFIRRVMAAGDIGFGEAFMAGEWESPDLSALLEALTWNFDRLELLVRGGKIFGAFQRLIDGFRRNSRSGARRNIHAHYDLGNAFFARWLDPSMTYSSGIFESGKETLAEAQRTKYARLAEQIDLRPGHTVLEIGCGWGGFAEFAARETGARVTAITISEAQHAFARQRMFEQGLAERVDVRLMDYRDVHGRFDRVASIEMFEAVGEAYWPAYFAKIRDVLGPGGRAGLQIITIRDELFKVYRSRSDFLRKYIFPGGLLPSETRLREAIGRAGLEWRAVSRFGEAYAQTLDRWAETFEAAWSDIRALGFDERFRRLWRFYLSYCEAGFRAGRIDVIQLGLSRS